MARLTKKASEKLSAHLGEQSKERLVEMVVEQAEGDVELRSRLFSPRSVTWPGAI